jgi:23S rRNA (adenine2030-N6)-methyltransferase
LWHKVAAAADCRRLGLAKTLRAELTVAPLGDPTRLNGCGLIIVNPPWTLADELAILLPARAKILGRGPRAGFRVDWLAGEAAAAG